MKKFILGRFRNFLIKLYMEYLILKGVDISKEAKVSLKSSIDFTNPKGVHIEKGAYIAFGATVLSHCFVRGLHLDTYIHENTFIGANALIMPGLHIGPNSIVGAGAVVTKDVPPNSIVVGNPARMVRDGIKVGNFGRLLK